MAESDLDKYLRQLTTNGKIDTGLITSRQMPLMGQMGRPAVQAPAPRFNYGAGGSSGARRVEDDSSGFWGLLKDVGSVGKQALGLGLKSLGPIDYGRRAWMAGLNELDKRGNLDYWDFGDSALADFAEDAVGIAFDAPTKAYDAVPFVADQIRRMRGLSESAPEGREKIQDQGFLELLNNPEFGYGQVLHDKSGGGFERAFTGSEATERLGRIADRTVGFAGDVAYDPTSYMSGGATAMAGKANRFALASKLAVMQRTVPEITDEMIALAATRGAGAFDDATRALINDPNLFRRGIRVGSPFGGRGSIRIAGTGRIDDFFSALVSRPRNALTRSKAYSNLIEGRRAPQGMETAYKVLRQGVIDPKTGVTPKQAALMLDWSNGFRAAENSYKSQWTKGVEPLLRGLDETQRIALTHGTQDGTDATLVPLLQQIRQELVDEGMDIGNITDVDGINGYMPFLKTRAFHDLMGPNSPNAEMALQFRKNFNYDMTARQGMSMKRTIRPNTKMSFTIGGETKEVLFEKATIKEANEKLTEAFPEAGITKWFEDDAGILMANYIDQASKSAAQVRSFINLLDVAPTELAQRLEEVSTEVIDEVATKLANAEAKQHLKSVIDVRDEQLKESAQRILADAELMKGDFIDALQESVRKLGSEGQFIARQLDAAKAQGVSLREAKDVVVAKYADQRKNLEALRSEAEDAFLELSAEADRLRIAAASGVDPSTPWAEVTRKALAKAAGDRRKAMQLIERQRDIHQKKVADFDARFDQMGRIVEQINYALHVKDQIEGALNDPTRLRNMIESEELFTDFEPVGHRVVTSPSGAQFALQDAKAKLAQAETDFDEFLAKQFDEDGIPVLVSLEADAVKQVRLAKMNVGKYKNALRRAWENIDAGARRVEESKVASVSHREFERLDDLVHFVGASKYEVDAKGRVRFLWGEDEKEFAYHTARQFTIDAREYEGTRGLLRQAVDERVAAEQQEAIAKGLMENAQGRTVPLPDKGGSRFFTEASKRLQRAIDESVDDYARARAAHAAAQAVEQSMREADPVAAMVKKFDELFNAGVDEADKVDFEQFLTPNRNIAIERATSANSAFENRSLEQFADELYAMARTAADDAVASSPLSREYRQLLDMQTKFKRAKQHLDEATANHRRVKNEHKKFRLAASETTPFAGARHNYLWVAQENVNRAMKKVQQQGATISRIEDVVYNTHWKPIVEGVEKGQLPYEAEVIQRIETANAAKTPLKLEGEGVQAVEGRLPRRYVMEYQATPKLKAVKKKLTPYEARQAELKSMTPEEREIYAFGETIDDEQIEASAETIDNMLGVGDEATPPRRGFGDQTDAERQQALEKGNRVKKATAELLLAVSNSEVTPLEAWKLSTTDDTFKNLRLEKLLASLPDSNNIRAISVMQDMGITSRRRVAALKVDDPRVGPQKLVEAVERLSQLKPVAKIDPDKVGGMLDVAQRIVDDGVVPEEVQTRLTQIARMMKDQDLHRRGLSTALHRDETVYASKVKQIQELTAKRDELLDAGPRGRQSQDDLRRRVQELNNDIMEARSVLAVMDEEALVRSQMVTQKLLGLNEFQELQKEFNDLVDWSNRYFAAVDAGVTEGDALSARVTAEIYKKRAKATQKRIDEGNARRNKQVKGSRKESVSDQDAAVEQAYDSLIAMLDAAEMVTIERRQFRRHVRKMEQESLRPIDGLEEVDESNLRSALVEAGLREEEEFFDDDYVDVLGRTVESLDRGDIEGVSITYGTGPSREIEERLKQLREDMLDRNRDLSRAVGSILGVGSGGGRDMTVLGNTRKLFVKRLRNEFRKAGPDGVRRVLREVMPDVQKNHPAQFMELLREHSNRARPERGVLASQQRVIDSLVVDKNDLPRAIRSAQTDLEGLQDDVLKLEAEIKEAVAIKRHPEAISSMRLRLDMKREAVERARGVVDRLMVPQSKKAKAADAALRRQITMDWRDALGVAPDGYVTPLATDNSDWFKVFGSYKAKRTELESLLSDNQRKLDRATDLKQRLQVSLDARRDDVVRAEYGIRDAERKLRQIPSGPQIVEQVRSEKAELLEKAGLLDETTERLSFQYDAFTEQLRDEAGMEAYEVADLERQIADNDFFELVNGDLAAGIDKKVKDVEAGIKRLENKKFAGNKQLGGKNIKEIRKEFESLVDVIDKDDMHGLVATVMYEKHVEDLAKHVELQSQIGDLRNMRSQAERNELHQIFKKKADQGFIEMGEILGKDNMIQVREPLANMITNIEKSIQSGAFIETIELANRFFKTYATLTPGFHVRNWMGATFMNLSEGVEVRNTREAYDIVARYRGMEGQGNSYMAETRVKARQGDPQAQRELFALEAAFGSGASGRLDFGEIGKANAESAFVRKAMETKTSDKVLANRLVKFSQRAGAEFVEMPIRVALALDSLDRGMTANQAIARIKRVHFDYSELSKFDKKMKALIPFWVFMSRNLPLQMQQILTKPKMYTAYNSVIRNFKADNQDMLQWQEERNGWVLFNNSDLFGSGSNVAILPDLQHVAMVDDLEKMDPRNPLRFLSQMNPLARVPAEFAIDKKFYKNQPFYEDESKAEYALYQTAPPLAHLSRLLGPVAGVGPYKERAAQQSLLNFLGVPLYDVPRDRMRND